MKRWVVAVKILALSDKTNTKLTKKTFIPCFAPQGYFFKQQGYFFSPQGYFFLADIFKDEEAKLIANRVSAQVKKKSLSANCYPDTSVRSVTTVNS